MLHWFPNTRIAPLEDKSGHSYQDAVKIANGLVDAKIEDASRIATDLLEDGHNTINDHRLQALEERAMAIHQLFRDSHEQQAELLKRAATLAQLFADTREELHAIRVELAKQRHPQAFHPFME